MTFITQTNDTDEHGTTAYIYIYIHCWRALLCNACFSPSSAHTLSASAVEKVTIQRVVWFLWNLGIHIFTQTPQNSDKIGRISILNIYIYIDIDIYLYFYLEHYIELWCKKDLWWNVPNMKTNISKLSEHLIKLSMQQKARRFHGKVDNSKTWTVKWMALIFFFARSKGE